MQPLIVACMLIVNGVILLSISKVETKKDILTRTRQN